MRIERFWMAEAENNLAAYQKAHRAAIDKINLRISATARMLETQRPPPNVPDRKKWALYRALTGIKGSLARQFIRRHVNLAAYSGPITPEQYAHDRRILRLAILAQEEEDALVYFLIWCYQEANARAVYAVQRWKKLYWPYTPPSKKRAKEKAGAKWYGGTYKTRVWMHAEQAAQAMENGAIPGEALQREQAAQAMENGAIPGEALQREQAAQAMENGAIPGEALQREQAAQAMGNGETPGEALQRWRSQTERLVNADGEHAESLGAFDAYDDLDAGRYQFISMLEKNTCKRCESLHGQIFAVYAQIIGVNMPPMHPWCQCTTRPVFSGGFTAPPEASPMRAGMTLEEWQQAQELFL